MASLPKSGMIVCALLLLCVNSKQAASTTCVDDATQELVAEIAECAAYYDIMANSLTITPGAKKLANTRQAEAVGLFSAAEILGKSVNISTEATKDRIKLHLSEMNKILAGNTGNWPTLMLRYESKCDALQKDITKRQIEILKRECPTRP